MANPTSYGHWDIHPQRSECETDSAESFLRRQCVFQEMYSDIRLTSVLRANPDMHNTSVIAVGIRIAH